MRKVVEQQEQYKESKSSTKTPDEVEQEEQDQESLSSRKMPHEGEQAKHKLKVDFIFMGDLEHKEYAFQNFT